MEIGIQNYKNTIIIAWYIRK